MKALFLKFTEYGEKLTFILLGKGSSNMFAFQFDYDLSPDLVQVNKQYKINHQFSSCFCSGMGDGGGGGGGLYLGFLVGVDRNMLPPQHS